MSGNYFRNMFVSEGNLFSKVQHSEWPRFGSVVERFERFRLRFPRFFWGKGGGGFPVFQHSLTEPRGPRDQKNSFSLERTKKNHSPAHEIFILAWKFHSRFENFILDWKKFNPRPCFSAAREGPRMKKPFSTENFIPYWKLDFFNMASRDWFFSILGPSGKGRFQFRFQLLKDGSGGSGSGFGCWKNGSDGSSCWFRFGSWACLSIAAQLESLARVQGIANQTWPTHGRHGAPIILSFV